VKIWGGAIRRFFYVHCTCQLMFPVLGLVTIVWLQWCTSGHVSQNDSMRITCMDSVYIFPLHIMNVNVITSHPVTISYTIFLEQFLYAFLYVSTKDMLTSYPCFSWLCCFQYAFYFCGLCKHGNEPSGHGFDRAVTIVITVIYHNTDSLIPTMCRQDSCAGKCHFMQQE
jgi:hypothetical protein